MPPPQQCAPVMELSADTELAISGHMQADCKETFLDPAACLICYDHTFGPAVVVTSSCGHLFHPKCIGDAMRSSPAAGTKCPCGAAFPPGRAPVVAAPRTHKQIMNGMEVQCPQGCGGVMPFELVRAHVCNASGCPNTPYRCGNPGCGAAFLRKDKGEHLRSCLHRLTPSGRRLRVSGSSTRCEVCLQPVKHDELQQHMAAQCLQRGVRCPHCDVLHAYSDKDEHMRGCTGRVMMKDLVELREMTAQLRDRVAQQQQTIERLGWVNAEQQRIIAQQQQMMDQQHHIIERQQRQGGAAPCLPPFTRQGPAPQSQPCVDRGEVAALPPAEQKQYLGEKLFAKIYFMQPRNAAKITGMLLEMDNADIVDILNDSQELLAKVRQAVEVLQEFGRWN